MKLKLFGATAPTVISLTLLSGGYDVDHGKVTVVVRGDDDRAGTLSLDITEARRLSTMLVEHTPDVERVGKTP